MNRVRLTDAARADIEGVWEYIAEDSIDNADRLVESLYEEILRVGASPGIGRRRTDLAGDRSILFWPIGQHLILYRNHPREIVVVAVLHGKRDIPAVLRDRGSDE